MSRRMSAEDPDELPQGQQPANGFVRIWVKDAEKVQCDTILILQVYQFILVRQFHVRFFYIHLFSG